MCERERGGGRKRGDREGEGDIERERGGVREKDIYERKEGETEREI